MVSHSQGSNPQPHDHEADTLKTRPHDGSYIKKKNVFFHIFTIYQHFKVSATLRQTPFELNGEKLSTIFSNISPILTMPNRIWHLQMLANQASLKTWSVQNLRLVQNHSIYVDLILEVDFEMTETLWEEHFYLFQ